MFRAFGIGRLLEFFLMPKKKRRVKRRITQWRHGKSPNDCPCYNKSKLALASAGAKGAELLFVICVCCQ
jgi:hypothetical protein